MENDSPRWSSASIWMFGTFGTGSKAGKRYHVRTLTALALIVVLPVLARVLHLPVGMLPWVDALIPAVGFGVIGMEWIRYLHGVDELERRLHWEALSITYVVMLVGAVTMGFVATAFRLNISPTWLILAELLRAAVLWHKSKQYR